MRLVGFNLWKRCTSGCKIRASNAMVPRSQSVFSRTAWFGIVHRRDEGSPFEVCVILGDGLNQAARGLLGSWPQSDMGVVLWSLSTAASDWGTPEKLSRLCTIPNHAVLENTDWDRGAIAFEARILQPLVWFGLLDRRTESDPGPVLSETYLYRKSQIFDRFSN